MTRRAADSIRDQLQRRLRQATTTGCRLLGLPDEDGTIDIDGLVHMIGLIEAKLAAAEDDTGRREAAEAHTRQLDRLGERYETRFDALKRAEQAVAILREASSPSAILSRSPKVLCQHSQLHRVVLSLLSRGFIVAEAAHFRDDAAGGLNAVKALNADPARLEHPLIETEIIRRRRATIVTNAGVHPRVHPPTAQIMDWHSYVAAPILVGGDVIGIIHADTGPDGRALDVTDGDVLWAFTRGVADVYETASLRRLLRRQREQMRPFVEWLSSRSSELSEVPTEFAREQLSQPGPPGQLNVIPAGTSVDDRVVFEDILTRRELDVLRLLCRGDTNRAIAAELVISEATVKFHVMNLLRKLHVANRAEAASRYHHLVQLRSKED